MRYKPNKTWYRSFPIVSSSFILMNLFLNQTLTKLELVPTQPHLVVLFSLFWKKRWNLSRKALSLAQNEESLVCASERLLSKDYPKSQGNRFNQNSLNNMCRHTFSSFLKIFNFVTQCLWLNGFYVLYIPDVLLQICNIFYAFQTCLLAQSYKCVFIFTYEKKCEYWMTCLP